MTERHPFYRTKTEANEAYIPLPTSRVSETQP